MARLRLPRERRQLARISRCCHVLNESGLEARAPRAVEVNLTFGYGLLMERASGTFDGHISC
jgi:hypothetical protein